MKKILLGGIVFAVVALVNTAKAEQEKAEQPLRLELNLTDGSRIIGVPDIDALPVETAYAKINLPLKQIATIKMDEDRETASISLINGDRLKGIVNIESVKLGTVFGNMSVSIAHIRDVRVMLASRTLPEALKQGLVLHYSFDTDESAHVKDLSGNGNHGSILEAQLVEDGKVRRGLKLDGVNDHVRVPNSESLERGQVLTLCAWVKLRSFTPGGYGNEFGFLINKGNGIWWNPAFCIGYSKESGKETAIFHVCSTAEDGGKTVYSETKLQLGKWYHLAGIYDGVKVKIYINGKLEGSADYCGRLRSDHAPVLLGGSRLGGVEFGNHFTTDATLDEVMIFDRALSDDDVRNVLHVRTP